MAKTAKKNPPPVSQEAAAQADPTPEVEEAPVTEIGAVRAAQAGLDSEDWEGYTQVGNRAAVLPTSHKQSSLCPYCHIPTKVTSTRGVKRYHSCDGHRFPTGKAVLGCGITYHTLDWDRFVAGINIDQVAIPPK